MTEPLVKSLFAVTEVELIYRNKIPRAERPKVGTAREAYDVLLAAWDMNRIELVEEFKMLLLDRGNRCLGVSSVATGGVDACVVDPKIVFATALKARASGLILAHNHPSGNLKPSQADIAMTQRLFSGGKVLSIDVLDHLIVTPHEYKSFADEGLMP